MSFPSTPTIEGRSLLAWREQRGFSHDQLALKLWISPRTIARWERGELAIPAQGRPRLKRLGWMSPSGGGRSAR